ncbi:MAG: phage holin family protein, partial [Minisyncoccia bacterium]
FLHWIISAIAIGVAAYIVPGSSVTIAGALIAAVVIGILNLLIKPIIFLLTLPLTLLTLGLFSLVINALLVWLASAIVPGFVIAGFWSALLFAIVLTLINWVFHFWSEL